MQRVHGNTRLVIPTQLACTKVPRDTSDPNSLARQSSGIHTRSSIAQKSAQDAEQSPIQLHADSPPHPALRARETTSMHEHWRAAHLIRPLRETESQIHTIDPSSRKDSISFGSHMTYHHWTQRNNILSLPELFDDALTNLHIALHPHTRPVLSCGRWRICS